MQQFEEEQRGRACGFTLHGDEGEGKRKKPIMIMSFSPLGVHAAAWKNKFPTCVPWPYKHIVLNVPHFAPAC